MAALCNRRMIEMLDIKVSFEYEVELGTSKSERRINELKFQNDQSNRICSEKKIFCIQMVDNNDDKQTPILNMNAKILQSYKDKVPIFFKLAPFIKVHMIKLLPG